MRPCYQTPHTRGALLLLLTSLWLPGHAQEPPSLVRVDPVRREPLAQTVPVLGRLVAVRAGTVAARIGGAVRTLYVEVGTRVERGQPIAELDDELLQAARRVAAAQIGEAEARLVTREAEQVLARQERQRFERLRDATSKSLYEDARQSEVIAAARVQEAQAALHSAREALHLREIDLSYARVVAPYAGVVSERLIEVGSYVQTGQALVRLVSDQALEVEADVPFARLGGLGPGTVVELSLDDATRHRARVRAVVPEENRLTRTRRVRFVPEFGDTRQALAVDQSATLHIPAGAPREVLSVHKDAINKRGNGDMVFVVVAADNPPQLVAKPRPVRLGEAIGSRFEVLQGLEEGERVVVRGNERLRPDAPVQIDGAPS